MPWRTFGDAEVLPLRDAEGPFFQPVREAFPDAGPGAWRRAAALDPAAFAPDGSWRLAFRCYAIRLPGGSVLLVDAGVGPEGSPAASWAPVPGRLPRLLAAEGVAPGSVEAVVLTHLHTDHVGWAVVRGEPFFPNARYVLQRTEADAVDALNPGLRSALLDPLRAAGRLELADGRRVLAGGVGGAGTAGGAGGAAVVSVVPTPGHTPGHQSVLVSSRGQEAVVTGDVLVHAVQLTDPETAYAHESDQGLARESRLRLLADAASRGALLATPHLGKPFMPAQVRPA